ncbi:Transmembrane protein [Phytophthora cinnamomi]|uniref:Transmembrane protein n=1 Tax=Phytophthora cinnamomi TaxID=4785 RepID=UPI00355A538F|nr:Transmembrane protein [Phytophthora cinnamomi]
MSNEDRDSNGLLAHPFPTATPLNIHDSRLMIHVPASETAFSDDCMPPGTVFYGADQDAEGATRGEIDGALVLDMSGWDSHALSTTVLAILAGEVVGYKVAINARGSNAEITQRMSSVKSGVCTPTHLNTEVWSSTTTTSLQPYLNESYNVGGVGYHGRSGLYVTRNLVEESIPTHPTFQISGGATRQAMI